MRSTWRRFFGVHTRFVRHLSLLPLSMWRPDQLWETGWVQSRGQNANIVVPEVEHTCTTGRGRVILLTVLLSQTLCNFSGVQTAPQYNSPCKPHIWHMFAVLRQLPHFPENCRGGGAFEKACEVQDQA